MKTSLEAIIGGASGPSPDESPKCGTLAVGFAETAKGRWTLQSAPADENDPTAGDFFVLAPNPYAPESEVVISTRITALDPSGLPEYSVQSSGRFNVDPATITSDGLIYCYDQDLATSTFSYLVQLTISAVLKVEKLSHGVGASACNGAPATWAFSGSVVCNLIG